jgi:hypothetical protein
MTESTLTLTQSGLLGLMLEHHHWKAYQIARRRAYLKRLGVAFRKNLSWSSRTRTTPTPLPDAPEPVAATVSLVVSTPVVAPHEIRTYPELQEQIHRDLRVQHPDWIEPNGECPMCDSYEARFTQLLDAYRQNESNESVVAIHLALETAANGSTDF